MTKIQLKSKKELLFPPFHKGIVRMDIDLIQNFPKEEKYVLRIIDTCEKEVEEEYQEAVYPEDFNMDDLSDENRSKITYETKTRKVVKFLGTPITRFSEQSYAKIKNLVQALQQTNPNIKKMDLDDANIETFRQGLYFITKNEIEQQGLKWYGCDSINDWEIVR